MYLPIVSPETAAKMVAELKCREGTLAFRYRAEKIYDLSIGRLILLEVPTGDIVYRLDRSPDLFLEFYHSSPGTGTRLARTDLRPFTGCSSLRIAFTWSSAGISLYVGDAEKPCAPIKAEGTVSPMQLRVGNDGKVYSIGSKGVTNVTHFQDGKPVLEPTAIECWDLTIEAVKVLLGGSSPIGFQYVVVSSNAALIILATGYEIYCRRRFLELEGEGIKADQASLNEDFLDSRDAASLTAKAKVKGVSLLRMMVEDRRINFQNYDNSKCAYRRAYSIKYGEDLQVTSQVLERLQRYLGYRHKIVHASPMIGMLNQESVPPEEPVFPTKVFLGNVIKDFSDFINGLHAATLRLGKSGKA